MDTAPDIFAWCAIPAGTQTARCGGTTHRPRSVQTVMTPAQA